MFRKRFIKIFIFIIIIFITNILTLYISVRDVDTLKTYRDIWIETAMNTFHHKWLATWFFPQDTINSVMNKRINTVINTEINTTDNTENKKSYIFDEYRYLNSGDIDFVGNTIYDVNTDEKIAIVNLSTSDYKGKLAIIEDPSRVHIAHTSKKNIIGNNICTFLNNENAILAVNASGFADYQGVGDGGEIMGASCASGEYWGEYTDEYNTIAFDTSDRLLIGQFGYWRKYNIRDGMQFNPALILNGQKQVDGSAGWGLQPRTAIGQREDGAVIILTIDGRRPGYSLGATMEQVADIMLQYGVINAAACDGGSSTLMGYNGEIITRCSSPQEGGRYLPNAFIVSRNENK